MESWYFDSLNRGYVSYEPVSPCDLITRTKNVLMDSDFKESFSCENSVLIPGQQTVENSGYPEVGFADGLRTQHPHDPVRDGFDNDASLGGIIRTSVVIHNVASGDDESSSRLSCSIVDFNSQESSLIDLKLGGIVGDKPNSNSSSAAPISSSSESSAPAKRVRVTNLSSQTAYCQVYGCKKDLSSAKDYYKRHKVCEAHSKTSNVIVNGLEQRFCQQCSRFHLIAEFDNGKRSCRKRLAGHNERRRKPLVGFNYSSPRRSLHSYAGHESTRFQMSTLTSTSTSTSTSISFICQEVNGFSGFKKYKRNDCGRHMKVEEDGTNYGQTSEDTCINGQQQLNSGSPGCLLRKQNPSVIDNRNNTRLWGDPSENIHPYPHGAVSQHGVVSHSLFQPISLTNEDLTIFDSASTMAGISDSGCAPSLLSFESAFGSSPLYSVNKVTEKGVGVHNRWSPYRDTFSSDFGTGIFHASELTNVKDHLSYEDDSIMDLLQLSSQLQQLENQRHSVAVKLESEDDIKRVKR